MSVRIESMSWVTPHGAELETGLEAVMGGVPPAARRCIEHGREHTYFAVPDAAFTRAAALPRMRRSGRISKLAVEAALRAVETAESFDPRRTALVMAATDGGVTHTSKFFGGIIADGPGGGSPLLFPETVYNASTSHIAAALGIDAECPTVVSDATAALLAIDTAETLLASGGIDRCLVVAAEEVDWMSIEGYRAWPLADGVIFAEGAAALLLTNRGGRWECGTAVTGGFRAVAEAEEKLRAALGTFPDCGGGNSGPAVPSLPGGPLGGAEAAAIHPRETVPCPKTAFGDSLCASTLMQVITACLLVEREDRDDAVVTVAGRQGQAAAARLTPRRPAA